MPLNIDDLILQLADIEQRLDALLQLKATLSSRQVSFESVQTEQAAALVPAPPAVDATLMPNISYIHSPDETQTVTFEPESLGVVASVNLVDESISAVQNQYVSQDGVAFQDVVEPVVERDFSLQQSSPAVLAQTQATEPAADKMGVLGTTTQSWIASKEEPSVQLPSPSDENTHEATSLAEATAIKELKNQEPASKMSESVDVLAVNQAIDHATTSSTLLFGKTVTVSEVVPPQQTKSIRVSQEIPNLIPIDGAEPPLVQQESLFEDFDAQAKPIQGTLRDDEQAHQHQAHEKIVLYKSSAKPKDRRTHYGPRSQNMTYVTYR